MPDLPQLLAAIRDKPDDGPRWLALASWLWDNGRDNGRDDEAAAVRVFWPTLRDNLANGVSLGDTLRQGTDGSRPRPTGRPRRPEVFDRTEAETVCPCCGEAKVRIGQTANDIGPSRAGRSCVIGRPWR